MGKPIVAGFSQGGHLTLGLAARHPSLVSVALPIAGWLPPSLIPPDGSELPPVKWQHGTDDSTVPYSKAKDTVALMRERDWDAELLPSAGTKHGITNSQKNRLHKEILDAAKALAGTSSLP